MSKKSMMKHPEVVKGKGPKPMRPRDKKAKFGKQSGKTPY